MHSTRLLGGGAAVAFALLIAWPRGEVISAPASLVESLAGALVALGSTTPRPSFGRSLATWVGALLAVLVASHGTGVLLGFFSLHVTAGFALGAFLSAFVFAAALRLCLWQEELSFRGVVLAALFASASASVFVVADGPASVAWQRAAWWLLFSAGLVLGLRARRPSS